MSLREKMQRRADELGVFAKRSLGQNFLVSESVVGKILAAVAECEIHRWLEVGPGLGALTDDLKERVSDLTLLELDRNIAKYWRERGCKVIEGDALKMDWESLCGTDSLGLVSNLPYQIAASIVIDRCLGPLPLKNMVLMFQKEVAQRITAEARGEHYGMLSVMAQTFWQPEMVCEAGPRDFWPAPKVASRVLKFSRRADPIPGRARDFLSFVKAAFAMRRKLVAKNLVGRGGFRAERVIAGLKDLGFAPERARAEELSVDDFLKLFSAVAGQ